MTIEEKAKAYDEALEKGRIFRDHLLETGDKGIAGEIEYIFPELVESKDEKIRNALIRFHKSTIDVDGIKGADILTWLEKQGNSSVKWQKNTPENKPLKNHSVLMKTVDGIAEGEWDGKYWHQYRWSAHIYDSNVLYWIELHDLEKQDEQKPAEWSDEDEHRVEDTIYFLDTAKKHYASTIELDACIDWLKSLKDRIGG